MNTKIIKLTPEDELYYYVEDNIHFIEDEEAEFRALIELEPQLEIPIGF